MKIIYRGIPEVVYPWTEKNWSCPVCGSIIQFDESDEPSIKYRTNGTDEELQSVCPVCSHQRTFTPVESDPVL